MDGILKHLSDLSWWFTVVVVGLIVGVVATYLKDLISLTINHLKTRIKQSREMTRRAEQEEIEKLSENPVLLQFELTRCNILFSRIGVTLIIVFLLLPFIAAIRSYPDFGLGLRLVDHDLLITLVRYSIVPMLILSVLMWWAVNNRYQLIHKAVSAWEQKFISQV